MLETVMITWSILMLMCGFVRIRLSWMTSAFDNYIGYISNYMDHRIDSGGPISPTEIDDVYRSIPDFDYRVFRLFYVWNKLKVFSSHKYYEKIMEFNNKGD